MVPRARGGVQVDAHSPAASNGNGQVNGFPFQTLAACRKSVPVEWIIPHFIPRGMVTILQGPKGSGKSSLAAYCMALELAAGKPANGQKRRGSRPRGFWASEEPFHNLVVPRLKAAGVKPGSVLWPSLPDGRGARPFFLPEGKDELEAAVKDGGVVLAVFDPFAAFVEKGWSANDEQHVREILDHCVRLGERYGVSFLFTQHFRKSKTESAADRGRGSGAICDVARSVVQLVQCPGLPIRRLMTRAAGNIGEQPAARYFELQAAKGVPRFKLGTELDASDQVDRDALEEASERTKFQLAVLMLKEELKDGEKDSKVLLATAERWAIKETRLWLAAEHLGVIKRRKGNGAEHKCLWSLPRGK
jgi:hypothetical protein